MHELKKRLAYQEPWFWFVWAVAILPILCSVYLIDYALSLQDDSLVEDGIKQGLSIHLPNQPKQTELAAPPVAYQVLRVFDQLCMRQLKGSPYVQLDEVALYRQGAVQPYQVLQLFADDEGLYCADLVKPLQGFQQGVIVVYGQDKTWAMAERFHVPFRPIIVESYAK